MSVVDGFFYDDLDRKFKELIATIEKVDSIAGEIEKMVLTIHNLGFRQDAERYRQLLAVWHIFGQMGPDGPII